MTKPEHFATINDLQRYARTLFPNARVAYAESITGQIYGDPLYALDADTSGAYGLQLANLQGALGAQGWKSR